MPDWEHLESYLPRIYRFALRLSGDNHLAEDLAQDALLRAWQNRRKLRNAQSIPVWLFRITVNLWRDRLRAGRKWPGKAELNIDTADTAQVMPAESAIQKEDVQQALQAMERLPPRQREVLHLSAVEELTLKEIGEVMGIRRDTAKVHLCAARKAMRRACFPAEQDITT